MAELSITGLSKHFVAKPPTIAIDNLDLEVADGEFVVLLGPSGCGKTTTLRCLAGLEHADTGSIAINGATVFDSAAGINVTPERRDLGMVFQSYALWPHMTVRENIGFPLRARRIRAVDRTGRIEKIAEIVDCLNLLDRYPGELSGGQQQRVAVARGLVARPGLILFDEPLSNLDARLRDQVRAELHQLHRQLGFTAVLVTHDQSEALALGDRLVIMRSGQVEQTGTPAEVFENPKTEYVTEFIGMSNRIQIDQVDRTMWVAGQRVVAPAIGEDNPSGSKVVRLRPDDVVLGPDGTELSDVDVTFSGSVVDVQYGGRHFDVVLKSADNESISARVPTLGKPTEGWLQTQSRVVIGFRWRDCAEFSIHPGSQCVPRPQDLTLHESTR